MYNRVQEGLLNWSIPAWDSQTVPQRPQLNSFAILFIKADTKYVFNTVQLAMENFPSVRKCKKLTRKAIEALRLYRLNINAFQNCYLIKGEYLSVDSEGVLSLTEPRETAVVGEIELPAFLEAWEDRIRARREALYG